MRIKRHTFAYGFKRARKKAGFTQERFAEEYGISVFNIRKWEQGKATPDVGTIEMLSGIFHCDLDYLFDRIEYETHDLQFIHDVTGLDTGAITALQGMKKNGAVITILNYLLNDGDALDKLIGYYASAFDQEAKEMPYLRGNDGKSIDAGIFFADVFNTLPADRVKFHGRFGESEYVSKIMAFEMLSRLMNEQDIKQRLASFASRYAEESPRTEESRTKAQFFNYIDFGSPDLNLYFQDRLRLLAPEVREKFEKRWEEDCSGLYKGIDR